MLNKVTLAILGMGLSGLVSAGTMGPVCSPDNVTVPCETKLWDIGIQALYLQPIYDADKAYALTHANEFNEIDNDWGWGYRIEGSYHFSTGNDITMTWVHYDVDSRDGLFQGSFPLIVNVPAEYQFFVTNQFDQVNFVFAQQANVGLFKHARFYGGLQYAKIRSEGKLTYDVSPAVAALVNGVYGYLRTQFYGVGPVVGVDYKRNLRSGLSLVANSEMSILYGNGRYTDSTYYGNGLVASDRYASKRMIVPALEMKLGANYEYQTNNGTLNLEAGYMVFNYFNALQHYSAAAVQMQAVDFGMYGPYFGVKWIGNV